MGFATTPENRFKTDKRRYSAGYCLIVDLLQDLPRKYDEQTMGLGSDRGYVLHAYVVAVLGAAKDTDVPAINSEVKVLLRANDPRKIIFDDLDKTREGMRFLLEGVGGPLDSLEARWAHGAGQNRDVVEAEIVGQPHVSFENPDALYPTDRDWLRLNLDGSDTEISVRQADGTWGSQVIPYLDMVNRLDKATKSDLKFRVGQRVLSPSWAKIVTDQLGLESALTEFRVSGFTHFVVRSFETGTKYLDRVDTQTLAWPLDIPASDTFPGRQYNMPMLRETPRFIGLRDGDAPASMEVIPGSMVSLIGNSDVTKSTSHKFVNGIVAGLSDSQKRMYAAQKYGPGVLVFAVSENKRPEGMTRLAIRTEGIQHPNLASIPTRNLDLAHG